MPEIGFWLYRPVPLSPAPAPPGWLSPAERSRWHGHQGPARERFSQSRALLRQALTQQTGEPFANWSLTAKGPPALATRPDWRLSLSHTRTLMLAGIAINGEVGVDLEEPRPERRWRDVAERWFAPAERDLLATLDDAAGREVFYLQWTLKEAWVKATGRGLANHFDCIQLTRNGKGDWSVSGDRKETDWCCRLGYWQDHVMALVWRAPGQEPPPLHFLTWKADRPEVLLSRHPVDVDWRIDTQIAPRSP